MLNEIINIDLHIHSSLSKYKEAEGYVDKSNIDNINVLLKKLNDNNINLFSITDHNRFDLTLYREIKKIISQQKYKNLLGVLPGIEFDVQIDEGKKSCHIICIFDDSKETQLEEIENVLNKNLLTKPDEYYTRDEFESILKEIGLSVLLIAHQHKHFDNKNGGKRSLSNSVNDIYSFVETGYISALEYQRPSVQGMIINSLKKVNRNVASIIGSDCHQWEFYPKKDSENYTKDYVSKIKSLPTFDGLVFAFTSVNTRFNRIANSNSDYISNILINNKSYPLSNGINAIIGDNGSGKTMMLDILANESLKKDYKIIKNLNNIEIIEVGKPDKEYIKQNQIIDDVRSGSLFSNDPSESRYNEIRTKQTFKNRIEKYSKEIIKSINKNIEIEEQRINLEKSYFEPLPVKYENVIPKIRINIKTEENEYEERLGNLQTIYESLVDEFNINRKFYSSFKEISTIINILKKMINEINKKYEKKNYELLIKGSIITRSETFNSNMSSNETDLEKEYNNYKNRKQEFVKCISNLIKTENKKILFPNFPKPIKGITRKFDNGYSFNKTTKYNDVDEKDNFYSQLFTKDYNEDTIKNINTKEKLVEALNGITKYSDLNNWYKKVDNFIDDCSSEETYIEKMSTKESMGKTPGEIAIVFYNFELKHSNSEKNVIMIDQPEDDISNRIISDELVKYINENRDKKQIIIVTHNPVLVVNLDVDNVIILNKDYKNYIDVKNGCLEYSNEDYSIISEIANNMDGGIETVEKRFRLYENKS